MHIANFIVFQAGATPQMNHCLKTSSTLRMKHQLAQPEALQFLWNHGQRTCTQSTKVVLPGASTC